MVFVVVRQSYSANIDLFAAFGTGDEAVDYLKIVRILNVDMIRSYNNNLYLLNNIRPMTFPKTDRN